MNKELGKKIIGFKKDLEKIGEVGWQEHKTGEYVVKNLGEPIWREKTALVYKVGEGKAVFFRAELDALNTSTGAKHLCGHSTHMASMMGAYLYFKENPPKDFCIYFVFQPAEEIYPSGADFVFKNFQPMKRVKAGFAFHVMSTLPIGQMFIAELASGDYFEIKITGRSVHVKDKNISGNVDALLAGSEIVSLINGKKNKNFVVNVGTLSGGDLANRIAGSAFLTGDARALTAKGREDAESLVRNTCSKVGNKFKGVKIDLKYFKTYPILKADDNLAKSIKTILNISGEYRSFATEDFALFKVPKILFSVGTGGKEELHSDNFKVKDKIALDIFKGWVKIGESLQKMVF
jgi:amidohydrolase